MCSCHSKRMRPAAKYESQSRPERQCNLVRLNFSALQIWATPRLRSRCFCRFREPANIERAENGTSVSTVGAGMSNWFRNRESVNGQSKIHVQLALAQFQTIFLLETKIAPANFSCWALNTMQSAVESVTPSHWFQTVNQLMDRARYLCK